MSEFYFPFFDDYELDERERALCEYFMRLQCMYDKAGSEFDYVVATSHEIDTLREAISNEFNAMVQNGTEEMQSQLEAADENQIETLSLPLIYTPGLGAAEIREQSALLRAESSAGSLILMMDDAIQRLRHSAWDHGKNAPKAGEFRLGSLVGASGYATTLIYAAGNAYRHAKDWDGLLSDAGIVDIGHRQFKDSRRTLDIIQAAIGLKAVVNSATCIAALNALSVVQDSPPTFEALWDGRLTDIGRDFARIYCAESDAYVRVSDALSYQKSVTSMEVSFSNDERLWGAEEST